MQLNWLYILWLSYYWLKIWLENSLLTAFNLWFIKRILLLRNHEIDKLIQAPYITNPNLTVYRSFYEHVRLMHQLSKIAHTKSLCHRWQFPQCEIKACQRCRCEVNSEPFNMVMRNDKHRKCGTVRGFNGDVFSAALHNVSGVSIRFYHFPVCTLVNTHMPTYTHQGLLGNFIARLCGNFFPIKFHLLQLGFHHPITVREAEARVHVWLHQAQGKYQSGRPVVLFLPPSLPGCLSSHVSCIALVALSSPLISCHLPSLLPCLPLSPFPFSLPLLFTSPSIAVSCKTHRLA